MFKKPQIHTLVLLAALLVLATGCRAGQVKLTAADKGKQVAVPAGGQLLISLEGNPTTGYTWEAQDLDTSLLKQAGEVKFARPSR